MKAFGVGNLIVYLALIVGNYYQFRDVLFFFGRAGNYINPRDADFITQCLYLAILPSLCACFVGVMFDHLRPRLVFQAGNSGLAKRFVLGALTAISALVISAVPVAYAQRWGISDAVIVCASSVIATVVFMAICRRFRPGLCIRCGFDLRASLNSGRCPECGTSLAEAFR